jgi:hypothetical protein
MENNNQHSLELNLGSPEHEARRLAIESCMLIDGLESVWVYIYMKCQKFESSFRTEYWEVQLWYRHPLLVTPEGHLLSG